MRERGRRRRGPRRAPRAPRIEEKEPQVHPLHEELEYRLKKKAIECLVCFDRVTAKQEIWSCSTCWVIMHLHCVKKWAKHAVEESKSEQFRCPACQAEHSFKDVPKIGLCFCGKVEKPEFDRHHVAHSCGQPCGRQRGTRCTHPCVLKCHPGPCPPCEAPGSEALCPCGKTKFMLRCGEQDSQKTCEKICRKLLDCKVHICKKVCHIGPCDPCDRTEDQDCFCGREHSSRACGSGIWVDALKCRQFSCGSVCGKSLDCGNHFCNLQCHLGPCPPCFRVPSDQQKCACGKTLWRSFVRKSCLDPLPICGQICNRSIACGRHKCLIPCHDSDCPKCDKRLDVPCRCGSKILSISCSENPAFSGDESKEFKFEHPLCSKKCKNLLSCGQHKCSRICCPGASAVDPSTGRSFHWCSKTCQKTLNCGNHICGKQCHLGHCEPCGVMLRDGVQCTCGKTRVSGPVPCGTEIRACLHPCSLNRGCAHPCPLTCHPSSVPCPPCMLLVQKSCAGGHMELPAVPCSAKPRSCGRPCGKLQSCGKHKCSMICHSGTCAAQRRPGQLPGDEKRDDSVCAETCGNPLKHCGHPCPKLCHPGTECSVLRCRFLITISCSCGRIMKQVECGIGDESDDAPRRAHSLACDDVCEIEKRQRALAEALKISVHNPLRRLPYTEWALHMALADYEFLTRMERILERFVKSSNSSLYLDPMPLDRRHLVHELCQFYGIASESLDQGGRRFVRLTQKPGSHLPVILMSEAAQIWAQEYETILTHFASPSADSFILAVKGISVDASPKMLRSCLQDWEGKCRFNHIDDMRSLVEFSSSSAARSAATSLTRTGNFEASLVVGKSELEAFLGESKQDKEESEPKSIVVDDAETKLEFPIVEQDGFNLNPIEALEVLDEVLKDKE